MFLHKNFQNAMCIMPIFCEIFAEDRPQSCRNGSLVAAAFAKRRHSVDKTALISSQLLRSGASSSRPFDIPDRYGSRFSKAP